MPPKVMVVYASAGSGHLRAAQAIRNCLEKKYPELDCNIIDILDYTNFLFAFFYRKGYSLLVSRLSFLWAICFYLTDLKCISWVFNIFCRLNSRRFSELLKRGQYQIILSTHFFPAYVAVSLKRKGRINARLVTAITDFGVHSLWFSEEPDDYIVASEFTRSRLIERGIDRKKINVMGIPIDLSFSVKYERDKSKRELTGLLVTGSFGLPLIEDIVDMIHTEIRLVVVCGSNQKLYSRLERKHYPGVQLFGFTEEMPRLMAQSDMIITKSGGLTIAESLAMDLPIIFICSFPGQEVENARVLQEYGCAINAQDPRSLRNIIIDLKGNPDKLDLIRNNIKNLKKPAAAENICRFIMKDVK